MSDTDLTESSIDGSIEPAIHIPYSPGDSGFYSPTNPSSPVHYNQNSFSRTLKPTKILRNHDEDGFSNSRDNVVEDNKDTLSVCSRISQFLNEQGYSTAPFIHKDIIIKEK